MPAKSEVLAFLVSSSGTGSGAVSCSDSEGSEASEDGAVDVSAESKDGSLLPAVLSAACVLSGALPSSSAFVVCTSSVSGTFTSVVGAAGSLVSSAEGFSVSFTVSVSFSFPVSAASSVSFTSLCSSFSLGSVSFSLEASSFSGTFSFTSAESAGLPSSFSDTTGAS